MQQIAVKDRTDFDKKLQQYQIIFAEAKDKVMYDLKDDIQDSSSFALVVVRCTQAIKCHEELHGYETDDMIVDLVHNVITSMPISSVEKDKIKNLYYPTILSIVNSLTAANKHYLSLKSKKDTEAAKKKQRKRRTRSIRSEAAPETLGVVADSAAPIIDMVALVQEVYHTATNGIRQRRLSAGTIISIGSQLMQIVEQYPQLSGTQKKEVVISVIHKIIEASDLTSQEKEDLTFVVDTVLSLVVNFIVKAYNGEIPFVNNIVEKVTNCFGKCCGSSE